MIFLVLFTFLFIAGCSQIDDPIDDNSTINDTENYTGNQTQSQLYFTVTDAAANMETISEVNVELGELEVYSQNQGWIEIETQESTFNLLELRDTNSSALFGRAQIEEGTYSQVRFEVKEIIVVQENGEEKEAKIPSNQIRFNNQITTKSNSSTSVELDFLLDRSLHQTKNGTYLLTPVIQVDVREDARITLLDQNKTTVTGTIVSQSRIGMNLNGTVAPNIEVPRDINISIDPNGKIRVGTKINGNISIDSSSQNTINNRTSINSNTQIGIN